MISIYKWLLTMKYLTVQFFSYYWDPITNKHNPYNAESLFLAYIISIYDSIDNIINKQYTLNKIK